jgi:ferredoxin-NADP reductase
MDAELPVWSGQNTPLYVTDIIAQTHDVLTFRFQGDPLCRFVYRPGQFCSLVLNIEGKKVVRSYTISSSPTRPYALEITVKRVPGGLVSNWLHDSLRVGDRIEVSGPKGKFCLVPGQIPPKILLIGAGSGVTPALSMGHWLCDVSAQVDIKFLNAVRTPRDVIGHKEIELMALRHRLFTPIFVASRGADAGWTGFTGQLTRTILEQAVPDVRERHIYMCGPPAFMDCVRDMLAEMKFDLANLHTESFGGVRTSVADKPVPLGAGGSVSEPGGATTGALAIEFARSGKVVATDGQLSLLDLAEANDVELPYGCRTGNCGDCKTKLLKGDVVMAVSEGLTAQEKAEGFILTCVGRPRTTCTLDA